MYFITIKILYCDIKQQVHSTGRFSLFDIDLSKYYILYSLIVTTLRNTLQRLEKSLTNFELNNALLCVRI